MCWCAVPTTLKYPKAPALGNPDHCSLATTKASNGPAGISARTVFVHANPMFLKSSGVNGEVV